MTASTIALPTQAVRPDRRWLALAVLVAAQFMVVLDVAIVNVALPTIRPTSTSARRASSG